jgi:hypothetical protein
MLRRLYFCCASLKIRVNYILAVMPARAARLGGVDRITTNSTLKGCGSASEVPMRSGANGAPRGKDSHHD